MAEAVASLPAMGFGGFLGAVAMTAIRALVNMRKINTDAAGVRDGLQAKRITELEQRMDAENRECHAKLDAMNGKLIIIAQVTLEVTAELRVHAPQSLALERARIALNAAFPVDWNTPRDMVIKAQKLDGAP